MGRPMPGWDVAILDEDEQPGRAWASGARSACARARTRTTRSATGAAPEASEETFDRLLHADREPQNWLSYSGTVFNQRYSPLTQITPANVKNLELQWVWQAKSLEKFEATALGGGRRALHAAGSAGAGHVSGRRARRRRPAGRSGRSSTSRRSRRGPCCGRVSRGLAILGDTLFMGTIDAHLVAIDAKTGKSCWDIAAAKLGEKPTDKYAITHAPLVVKDKIIVGMAGGDLRRARLHRRVRREDRQGSVALLHHSRPGRAGQRDLVGRLVEDRRRRRLEQRRVRRGSEPRLLRHRQSRAGLGRPRRASATTCTATASSRSTPTPAS